MTDISPDGAFVAQFNARLEALNSSARVALAEFAADAHLLELRDDEENFLELIPPPPRPRWPRSPIGSTVVASTMVSASEKLPPGPSFAT